VAAAVATVAAVDSVSLCHPSRRSDLFTGCIYLQHILIREG
jgi:hypothetical protein